jgi:GTP cyclohydrolase IA
MGAQLAPRVVDRLVQRSPGGAAPLGQHVQRHPAGHHRQQHLADTPRRVAAAFAELLTPVPFSPTTFPNDEGYDELVVTRGIPFASLCRHHLLPFSGLARVGYLPGDRILGLSKLARVALEAEHVCMTVRGVQAPGVRIVTSALRGRVRDDPRTRAEFLALATTGR